MGGYVYHQADHQAEIQVQSQQQLVAAAVATGLIDLAVKSSLDRGYIFDDDAYRSLEEFVLRGTKLLTQQLSEASSTTVMTANEESAKAKAAVGEATSNLRRFTDALTNEAAKDPSAQLASEAADQLLERVTKRAIDAHSALHRMRTESGLKASDVLRQYDVPSVVDPAELEALGAPRRPDRADPPAQTLSRTETEGAVVAPDADFEGESPQTEANGAALPEREQQHGAVAPDNPAPPFALPDVESSGGWEWRHPLRSLRARWALRRALRAQKRAEVAELARRADETQAAIAKKHAEALREDIERTHREIAESVSQTLQQDHIKLVIEKEERVVRQRGLDHWRKVTREVFIRVRDNVCPMHPFCD